MHAWTKSACAVLAWSLFMIVIVVTAGLPRPGHPLQAHAGMTSSTTRATALAARQTAAAAQPAAAGPPARYVVRPGDTLAGIAARFAVPGGWPALYAASQPAVGPDPALIRPGTVLTLPARPPAPARYRVRPGDTLAGIAARFAVPGGWPALYAASQHAVGPDPALIRPGTILTIPHPATTPRPAAGPGPRRHLTHPPAAPGTGHHRAPGTTPPPAAAGMPSWLTRLLLAAALVIAAAFLTEPLLLPARRRRRKAATAAAAAAAAGPARQPAAAPGTPREPAVVPARVPRQRGPGDRAPAPGDRPAPRATVVRADYGQVVVTYHQHHSTVSVLSPPGHDPAAILRAARLVLPEGPYRDLAAHLGLPASWPIMIADYDRLVVTCSPRDGTVCILRPPGHDPAAVLRAARLVLPEDPYEELAEQLGLPASLPTVTRRR